MRESRRAIPSVEKVLQALGRCDLPRPTVVATVRSELASLRKREAIPDFSEVLKGVRASLDTLCLRRIQAVTNGTGILVHTNLGRAPIAATAVEELSAIASNYNNLEIDLAAGKRGKRAQYLEHNLALLCGAESATSVNNCAAALVLILRHFTSGKKREVVISRGELIQIGGGFRIPDILESTGAALHEAGTTNKTTLSDYEKAINRKTALILKVHRSNFSMDGFVQSPSTKEISALANEKRIPFVEDLGSGAVITTENYAFLEHEPTPEETLRSGVDLVCFSGDKLLGGPQAGIIAGRAKLVAALKSEPFFRALRCDKLILSTLQTTVDLYLSDRAEENIPLLTMLRVSKDELKSRAENIVGALKGLPLKTSVGKGEAQIGGGALPRSVIPSVTVDLVPQHIGLDDVATQLRSGIPPVVGYIADGCFRLDLRTIFPHQDHELISAIRTVLGHDKHQKPIE